MMFYITWFASGIIGTWLCWRFMSKLNDELGREKRLLDLIVVGSFALMGYATLVIMLLWTLFDWADENLKEKGLL